MIKRLEEKPAKELGKPLETLSFNSKKT